VVCAHVLLCTQMSYSVHICSRSISKIYISLYVGWTIDQTYTIDQQLHLFVSVGWTIDQHLDENNGMRNRRYK